MVSRELGISEQTYYRWRQEFGGMKVDQARRFKELEVEGSSSSPWTWATPESQPLLSTLDSDIVIH
jgi:transposase-like protein